MSLPSFRTCMTELFGTFLLTVSVGFSLLSPGPIATPIIAALTLGLLVYAIGPISGCHINPAVTLALWSIGKISRTTVLRYIASQCAGALLGALLIVHVSAVGNFVLPSVLVAPALFGPYSVMLGEFLGAAIFLFGISSVVHSAPPDEASGIVIGGSLLLGILAASLLSSGILNPAVAIGLRSVSLAYLLAPVVGGITGAWLYRLLFQGK